ncbi:MAG: AAA family ATPase [Kangiella sp.]|nr:AAA family ATPase [Kangiella sp.]
MPIHNGHLFIIETASKLVDELTVLVCSTEHEPIDGILRAQWVKESVNENVVVQELHEDMPQLPEDDPNFWDIWKNAINRFGTFDKVFGGEDYVIRLAKELEAAPVQLGRTSIDISATMIRNSPGNCWNHIPPAVRPYFQKRVTFLGPESTGKSTFSEKLANRYNPTGYFSNLMTEYGRIFDSTLKQGKDWSQQDFQTLSNTHIAMREALAPHAGPLLVEDTDVIQTMAWENALMGDVSWESYNLERLSDLYLLLSPDVPWVDDGTRYGEQFRLPMFNFLKRQFERLGQQFVVIDGPNWKAREERIYATVDRFMAQTNNH